MDLWNSLHSRRGGRRARFESLLTCERGKSPLLAKDARHGARIIKGRPFRVGCGCSVKSRQPKLKERNTLMNSVRYVGMDVHRDTISVAVLDESGRLMMQSVLATRAGAVLDFIHGVRGRNAFGLALRCAGAASREAGGVQSAEERADEVWEQE